MMTTSNTELQKKIFLISLYKILKYWTQLFNLGRNIHKCKLNLRFKQHMKVRLIQERWEAQSQTPLWENTDTPSKPSLFARKIKTNTRFTFEMKQLWEVRLIITGICTLQHLQQLVHFILREIRIYYRE